MSLERRLALELLLQTERDETASPDRLLKETLKAQDDLKDVQKSFLVQLVQGTLRYRIRLDDCLDRYSKTPVNKMKPLIRNLLRMSVYQILFLDDVPDAAACDEAVRLAKEKGFSPLTGFVNGVLRTIARKKDEIIWPDREDPSYLSVMYAMPKVLSEHFKTHYGEEKAEEICAAFLAPRPVMIRLRRARMKADGIKEETLLDRMRTTAQGITITPHDTVPDVFVLTHPGNPVRLYGFHEGYFTIQDAASVEAVQSAGIKTGDSVIDVCASPGGKAACAADFCKESGQVLARDVSEAKVRRMDETLRRLGCETVKSEVYDARKTDARRIETADVLICDVPCSALGIIGRKPEVKYRFSAEGVKALTGLQREIVSASWQYVKQGGTLLYCTCTLNPSENEEQVAWIQKEFPFTVVKMKQLFPGEADTDGFFYAVLQRDGSHRV